MATAETKLMTADEFYDWANRPENRDKYCELERGEIVEMSRPGRRHGLVCANVVGILGNFTARWKKGYICSNGTGVVVERNPDTVRGYDILLFDDARRFEEVEEKYGETPPLISVEVLWANKSAGQVMRRIDEQLRFGTQMVWVVDPDARNVIVHQPGEEPLIFEETEELTGGHVLPNLRCRVAEFFNLPGEQRAAR
jgi:Uma2 family endonuclease